MRVQYLSHGMIQTITRLVGQFSTGLSMVVRVRYPQRQKQALTQMRGAVSFAEQPHIEFCASQSAAELHSL